VKGEIRQSESRPEFGHISDPTPAPGKRVDALYMANVGLVAMETPYSLLPVYVQQAPDPAWTSMPYRSLPELDLTEGPHLGYAIQWFTFAAILGVGYPFFVKKELDRKAARTSGKVNSET
jgi:surfeit locus 1 family protein